MVVIDLELADRVAKLKIIIIKKKKNTQNNQGISFINLSTAFEVISAQSVLSRAHNVPASFAYRLNLSENRSQQTSV